MNGESDKCGRIPTDSLTTAAARALEAEIALVSRDLGCPAKALDAARATIEEQHAN